MKPLTLQDACIALNIDSATLWRWCKHAHIIPEQDTYDKRRRILTAMQAQHLAELHHISLATLQANGYYLLDPADLADLQVPTLPTETNIATTLADILTRLEAMEYYLQSLEDEVVLLRADLKMPQEASQHTSQMQPPKTRPTTQKAPVAPPGDADGVIWLTDDLVAWRSFCRVHHLSEGTIHKAIISGRVPVVHGEWRIGSTSYNLALNKEGRQKIYELYHDSSRFLVCPLCPH